MRKERKAKKTGIRKWVLVSAIACILVVTGILFAEDNRSVHEEPIVLIPFRGKTDKLAGVFVYGDETKYEFDGRGKGCMCLTYEGHEHHYAYKYTMKDDQLFLKFKENEATDATYTYQLDGDVLTLEGGEGTAGGTYVLTRK